MSWWVSLNDEKGDPLSVDSHSEGGTYVLGGTHEASLNITYNYSEYYYKWINKEFGLRWLDGQRAWETINALAVAVENLGAKRDDDYWAATEGNAGYAASILLAWAKQHHDGIWRVN
jgi:hypothetical protein